MSRSFVLVRLVRFVFLFGSGTLASFALSQCLLRTSTVIVELLQRVTALAATQVLQLAGVAARAHGTLIEAGHHASYVSRACLGVNVWCIGVGLILASVHRRSRQAVALGCWTVSVWVLNIIRLASVMLAGLYSRSVSWWVHDVLWEEWLTPFALATVSFVLLFRTVRTQERSSSETLPPRDISGSAPSRL